MTGQQIREWVEHLPMCDWDSTNVGDILLVIPGKGRVLDFWKTFRILEARPNNRFWSIGFYRDQIKTIVNEAFGPEFDGYENCWNLTQLGREKLLPTEVTIYFAPRVSQI